MAAAAHAQQAKIPRIGIIDDSPIWNDFRQGLRDLGYLEGQNIAFEYRYAGGLPEPARVGRGGAIVRAGVSGFGSIYASALAPLATHLDAPR